MKNMNAIAIFLFIFYLIISAIVFYFLHKIPDFNKSIIAKLIALTFIFMLAILIVKVFFPWLAKIGKE